MTYLEVDIGKGNAVLFYDLLPDGNGDDKSLHEAVRLRKGEKWICQFPNENEFQSSSIPHIA